MPVGEIGEDMLDEAAVDLADFEHGTDGTGIGKALADEEALSRLPLVEGDEPHGALLLLPERQADGSRIASAGSARLRQSVAQRGRWSARKRRSGCRVSCGSLLRFGQNEAIFGPVQHPVHRVLARSQSSFLEIDRQRGWPGALGSNGGFAARSGLDAPSEAGGSGFAFACRSGRERPSCRRAQLRRLSRREAVKSRIFASCQCRRSPRRRPGRRWLPRRPRAARRWFPARQRTTASGSMPKLLSPAA